MFLDMCPGVVCYVCSGSVACGVLVLDIGLLCFFGYVCSGGDGRTTYVSLKLHWCVSLGVGAGAGNHIIIDVS